NGGAFVVKGNATLATSDVIGRLGFGVGGSTLILDKNGSPSVPLDTRGTTGTTTLNRAAGSGATVDINVAGGGVLGTDALILLGGNSTTNGILGSHATVNGYTDWAGSTGAGSNSV